MVSSVSFTTKSPDFARFKCSEPPPPYGPVFRRTVHENVSAKALAAEGTPEQQGAWKIFASNAKRALQSWQRMPAQEYSIKPPFLTGLKGAPHSSSSIWTGRKDSKGAIHIHSCDVPLAPPHLTIIPGRTPLEPAVAMFNGRVLGVESSLEDLEIANLLAETLDYSV